MAPLIPILLSALALALAQPAVVRAAEAGDVAHVPDDDIFGFTSSADLGDAGPEIGVELETDGRLGKRDGRYRALGQKFTVGQTFARNWWGGIAVFGAGHDIRGVSAQPADRRSYQFDGASIEIAHTIIDRTKNNPVKVTLSFEPRWGKIDGGSGFRVDSFTGELKLFADMALIRDRLFLGVNLNYAPSTQQEIGNRQHWIGSASTNVSGALTWALSDKLYIGGEVRYQTAFERPLLRTKVGYALYAGPTVLVEVLDNVTVNATWQPQIRGHARDVPERFDLDNFEKRTFRFKVAAGF